MNNEQIKDFCTSLINADTESEVIEIINKYDYWDDEKSWRYYGDRDTNYNTIGNQQSRPDAALVEKIINSVDAKLMSECILRKIDPEGSSAPKTIQQAVAQFFDEIYKPNSLNSGQISEWSSDYRTRISKGITLCATGSGPKEGKPSLTISDDGEGQTPDNMPYTLLSLDRRNKFKIPFVQGKFNMGGTGVLKFCGHSHLQLVLSKRNPKLFSKIVSPEDRLWGFTIVRRENPDPGGRSSVFSYLAPLGADERKRSGGVLRFHSEKLQIFPSGSDPYSRSSEWGTLIKLYEYSGAGYSNTHILLRDGLLSRLDLLLPDIALPIRLYECRRTYSGHKGSFDTTLNGLSVRLNDNKADNVEDYFPDPAIIKVMGEKITATIYAFKKGRAETYRKNEGIIFTVNGQTHGHLTDDFFRRKEVGLSYLSDSILIIMDCSEFSNMAREDLFMNSRDRLSGGELRLEIEQSLQDLLKHHEGLRALKERRRREETEEKLENSKPLEDILKSLIERYPSLSTLFMSGNSITNPFKTIKSLVSEEQFVGKKYPSYFRFKGKEYGYVPQHESHINMRCRISFETDAMNDYFKRDNDPGTASLYQITPDDKRNNIDNYIFNIYNGIATLSFRLPEECKIEGSIKFLCVITDPSRIEPFENNFIVKVLGPVKPEESHGDRHKSKKLGDEIESEISAGIQIPKPRRVFEAEWNKFGFDQFTALTIKYAGEYGNTNEGNKNPETYDFKINMDNIHLKRHYKMNMKSDQDEIVAQTRFEVGMVLIGLALINQSQKDELNKKEDTINDDEKKVINVEDQVATVTKAIAPFILPMIESLGALDFEDVSSIGSGEAT